ncbi:MAG: protein-disulfide reductase DsbD domain-containing protein [Bacteroidota bacterium]
MKHFLNLCFCLLFANFASAQLQKVTWEATLEKGDSDEYTLVLQGTIEHGWYLYSQYLESDEGPIATKVVLNEMEGMESIGKTKESGNKVEGYDNIFLMNITKYKEDVTFKQLLKLPKDTEFVSGTITFMTCDDEQCLPPTEVEFTAELAQ